MFRKFMIGSLAGAALLLSGCPSAYEDPFPRQDRVHWPIGLTVHPNGRFLYVVNSNFDTRYREDVGGTISVFDLETGKLLPGQGPYIPSFGGHIKLNGDASRAYVTARLDNQLLVLDVAPNGSAISCGGSSDSSACGLNRVPNTSGSPRIPTDPFGLEVATEFLSTDLEIQTAAAGTWRLSVGAESYTYLADAADSPAEIAQGLAEQAARLNISATGAQVSVTNSGTNRARITAPAGGQAQTSGTDTLDIVALSHLRSTNLTSLTVRGDLSTATMRSAEFVEGTNAVAMRPGTRDFYAAGRFTRDLAVFQPYIEPNQGAVQALVDRGRITLNGLTTSVDARALAFEPDGNTLYVATRNPDALHVVELMPQNLEVGTGLTHRVITAIPLDRRPSDIVRVEQNGRTLLYVPCFDAQSIQVIDPRLGAVIDQIEIGARPYVFAFDPVRNLGYVSLFEDLARSGGSCANNLEDPCGSIGVIDLDPSSPRYHRLIRKMY